jgi:hypothetical protein
LTLFVIYLSFLGQSFTTLSGLVLNTWIHEILSPQPPEQPLPLLASWTVVMFQTEMWLSLEYLWKYGSQV